MTQILNLDELETGLEKAIKFGGKTHKMQPMSVGDYIAQLKELAALQEEKQPEKAIEVMVTMIARSFPSMKEAEVRKMNMSHIKAITDFIRDQTEAETDAGNAQ